MHNDFFDLDDLSDISEQVRKELNRKNSTIIGKILQLFNFKQTLTVDEILVGFYRKYGELMKRNYLQNRLYTLCKTNRITKNNLTKTYKKI